jgi:hypothetical protein
VSRLIASSALIALMAVSAAAQEFEQRPRVRRAAPAELTIDEAAIKGGQLVVTGRTAKPNQVIEIVNTGDKTISLPTRRFSFSLSYMPENCRLHLRSNEENLQNQVVANCIMRGNDGKDGKDGKDGVIGKDGRDGKDGKDGRDGRDGFVYGSLPGDSTTNKCWPSDLIGLWFIRDYPGPNSRTIAHIVPDRVAGGNKMNVTEPGDPLKTEADGRGVTQWAEFDGAKFYILNRDTKARNGVRGDVAADCRSIVWKGDAEAVLKTWER